MCAVIGLIKQPIRPHSFQQTFLGDEDCVTSLKERLRRRLCGDRQLRSQGLSSHRLLGTLGRKDERP